MAQGPEKILVVMLGPIRGFVLAAATMAAIRAAHPKALITLLTTLPFEGLARAAPYFNTVEADGDVRGGEWFTLIRRLRRARFRRVYDLQGSAASAAIVTALGPFGPRRSSSPAGAGGPPDLSWILKSASSLTESGRKAYALLVPGASETPPAQRLTPDRYAEIGRMLQARGLDVIILGGAQDSDVARTIQHKTPGARDLTVGLDLTRIAQLSASATVAIGADCGLLHLAAAAGAPTVVLYAGAGDPALSAPRGHVTVLHAANMSDLRVEAVLHAVELLSPAGVRSA